MNFAKFLSTPFYGTLPDDCFCNDLDGKFVFEGHDAPFQLDRNKLDGGIMRFVRSDIPVKLLSVDIGFESVFIEFNF